MRMLETLCAAAVLASPLAATAQELSYNYVEAGYVQVEPDDGDIEFDGFRAKVSGQIAEQVYLFASYGEIESDEFLGGATIEQEVITAGLGYRIPVAAATDLTAEAAFVSVDVSAEGPVGSGSDDDTGFGLGLGLRHLFTPYVEGAVNVDYVDVFDEDETTLTLSGLFHLTPALSLGAGYSISDDADGWTVGGRFNF